MIVGTRCGRGILISCLKVTLFGYVYKEVSMHEGTIHRNAHGFVNGNATMHYEKDEMLAQPEL